MNEVWGMFNSDVPKAERSSKIGEILKQLEQKLAHVCCKHDGSRAVQKLIKYGLPAQRQTIYDELKGKMAEFSLDKHAHFIVIQLLKCEVDAIRQAVMQELMSHVPRLALHNTAASVIDYMYASGKPKDKLRILAEFYGQEYALFAKLDGSDTVQTLSEVLAARPDKASLVLASIQKYVDKCSTKDMFLFRPLHGLLAAYLPHASPITREQLISICSGKVLPLHHSQEGAALVCECLGQGSAKTRKAVIKGLKGRVFEVASNSYGHVILIRALQVIDDTALINSGILSELKQKVEELLVDPYGVKVLLFASVPSLAGLSTQSDRDLLDGEATSKKNPILRRTEVFLHTINWLLPALQANLALISDPLGSKVLIETLMHCYQVSDPTYATTEGKDVGTAELNKLQAVRAPTITVVEELAGLLCEESNLSLVEDPNVQHHLKRLFSKTIPTGKPFAAAFSKVFSPLISQPALPTAWLSNRGAFVLATIAESDEKFKASLKRHVGEIKQVDTAGTKLLVQVLEESAAQREQRLAQHKDEVAQAEGPTQEQKRKKRKQKKRPVAAEGEYKDPALVGMVKKKKSNLVDLNANPTTTTTAEKAKSKQTPKQPKMKAAEAAELDLDMEGDDEGDAEEGGEEFEFEGDEGDE